jgi:hypothetical protein
MSLHGCHRSAGLQSNQTMHERTYLSHRTAKIDPAQAAIIAGLELIDRDLDAAGVFLPTPLRAGSNPPNIADVFAARTVARLVQAILRAA